MRNSARVSHREPATGRSSIREGETEAEDDAFAFVRRASINIVDNFSVDFAASEEVVVAEEHEENGLDIEARFRAMEAKLDAQEVRLQAVELVSGIEREDSGDGEDDTDRLLANPAIIRKETRMPVVLRRLDPAHERRSVHIFAHEIKSSCIALTVAFPSIAMIIATQFISEYIIQNLWADVMSVRCIICHTSMRLGWLNFNRHKEGFVEKTTQKSLPAAYLGMLLYAWSLDWHPGIWSWFITIVGEFVGKLATYKHEEYKEYPPFWRYVLKNCVATAIVPFGLILSVIYTVVFVVTKIERELYQVAFTACVYPSMCLILKRAMLGFFCNEEFLMQKGGKGLGVMAASCEIGLNFIGNMVLFSKIESLSIGFLSAAVYMMTEVSGKFMILYAMESVFARNALIMPKDEALEKLRIAKENVAHRWAYEMVGEKMLLLLAPVVCIAANTSDLTLEEMGTIAGIFFTVEIFTDVSQCYVLEKHFAVPITTVSVRPSGASCIFWAGVVVANGQCVQMGFSTFESDGVPPVSFNNTLTNETTV
ncbi:hypothetical protein TrCOL_g13916 [Triparma columacea]|uniref:Uncharacterized protein n=1 Tax=Triparma columacea TaxID=722753 RepID=A0A9W7GHA4_9STRA|nr:hypothetical protein TrCOL_g13916 [Triparma columacea]